MRVRVLIDGLFLVFGGSGIGIWFFRSQQNSGTDVFGATMAFKLLAWIKWCVNWTESVAANVTPDERRVRNELEQYGSFSEILASRKLVSWNDVDSGKIRRQILSLKHFYLHSVIQ